MRLVGYVFLNLKGFIKQPNSVKEVEQFGSVAKEK